MKHLKLVINNSLKKKEKEIFFRNEIFAIKKIR